MQIGKKYRWGNDGRNVYVATQITPDGNMVVKDVVTGREALVEEKHFKNYVEVKEPVVRYVHWYKNKEGRVVTDTNTEPASSNRWDSFGFDFVKTDKVTCDV